MTMLDDIHTRPQSVINIIEIPDASESNPRPDNDTEKQLGEFISAQKLKEIGGVSNLLELHELTVEVDTSETSIGNVGTSLGSLAPNLEKLNLNNSFVTSVRDLGTCLNNLNTLWLSRCCLQELDGISCMSTLKELFVAYNEILDLSPLSILENIEVLDLEGNKIDDIMQLEFLTLCHKLKLLTVKGNPVEHSPTPTTDPKDLKHYSYREAVLSCLPQITLLDDEKFIEEIKDGKVIKRDNPKHRNSSNGHFKDGMQIIPDNMKAIERDCDDNLTDSIESSMAHPLSAHLRNVSATPTPTGSSNRYLNSSDKNSDESFEGSGLTHGSVLCGNPIQFLRRRATKKTSKASFQPEHSYLSVEEDALDKDDVFEQLKSWRLQNKSLFGDVGDSSISSRNNNNRIPNPVCSPSPPSTPKPNVISSQTRRNLGVEQTAVNERPSTAADFRVFEADSDVVVFELDVIDECNVTSIEKSSFPAAVDQNGLTQVRPLTARAALQTSSEIVNCRTKDDT